MITKDLIKNSIEARPVVQFVYVNRETKEKRIITSDDFKQFALIKDYEMREKWLK